MGKCQKKFFITLSKGFRVFFQQKSRKLSYLEFIKESWILGSSKPIIQFLLHAIELTLNRRQQLSFYWKNKSWGAITNLCLF